VQVVKVVLSCSRGRVVVATGAGGAVAGAGGAVVKLWPGGGVGRAVAGQSSMALPGLGEHLLSGVVYLVVLV
jgi:hypothetical protein